MGRPSSVTEVVCSIKTRRATSLSVTWKLREHGKCTRHTEIDLWGQNSWKFERTSSVSGHHLTCKTLRIWGDRHHVWTTACACYCMAKVGEKMQRTSSPAGHIDSLSVVWAQSDTKDYIKAKSKLQSVSYLFCTQVIKPQILSHLQNQSRHKFI